MIETLMALNVVDPDLYAKYRAAMTPLLEAHGGSFGLDLWVGEVLRAPRPEAVQSAVYDHLPVARATRSVFLEPRIPRCTKGAVRTERFGDDEPRSARSTVSQRMRRCQHETRS